MDATVQVGRLDLNEIRNKIIYAGTGDPSFTEELRNYTGRFRRELPFEIYYPPGKQYSSFVKYPSILCKNVFQWPPHHQKYHQ